MNPFEKLPYDLYIKIDRESERRIYEFYKKNPEIEEKLNFEEKEKLEDWISTITTYEFYRKYGITEKEMKNYHEENKISIRDELPEFKDLPQ